MTQPTPPSPGIGIDSLDGLRELGMQASRYIRDDLPLSALADALGNVKPQSDIHASRELRTALGVLSGPTLGGVVAVGIEATTDYVGALLVTAAGDWQDVDANATAALSKVHNANPDSPR